MAEEPEAGRTPEGTGDTPEPEAGSGDEPEPEAAPEAAPAEAPGESEGPDEKPRTRGRWLLWLVLLLCGGVAALETAGLLLTHRLEGRRPPLARAPALAEPAPPAGTRAPATSRFGPDVWEVEVVGRVPGPVRPAEPAAKPETEPAATAAEPAPAPGARPPSAEGGTRPGGPPPGPTPPPAAPPRPQTTTGPKPAPARAASGPARKGRYALQVGIFRSQRYRNDLEARLTALGVPHFRRAEQKRFRSYRLTVQGDGPVLERAARVLEDLGYESERSDGGLVAFFFLEEEARKALEGLVRAGLRGGYARHEGPAPVWTVYAGPFATRQQAETVRERLAGEGVRAYLRRLW